MLCRPGSRACSYAVSILPPLRRLGRREDLFRAKPGEALPPKDRGLFDTRLYGRRLPERYLRCEGSWGTQRT